MTRDELMRELQIIAEKEFEIEKDKADFYGDFMLENIGDEDPELRDELIYTAFVEWIAVKEYMSLEKTTEILEKTISEDHMFYRIGSKGDSSVLRRSFSALVISLVLGRNEEENFLSDELLLKTKDAMLRYIKEEKDLRGYDEKLGWVHAMAHVADGVNGIIECECITDEVCKEIIGVIGDKICEGAAYFAADEYERMMNPIHYNIIEDEILSDEYLIEWFKSMGDKVDSMSGMEKIIARTNLKNFGRSLYFRLIIEGGSEELKNALIELEKGLNIYAE